MKITITSGEYTGRVFDQSQATISSDGRYAQIWIGKELVEFKFGLDCQWTADQYYVYHRSREIETRKAPK